jgi:hypothetical protein
LDLQHIHGVRKYFHIRNQSNAGFTPAHHFRATGSRLANGGFHSWPFAGRISFPSASWSCRTERPCTLEIICCRPWSHLSKPIPAKLSSIWED